MSVSCVEMRNETVAPFVAPCFESRSAAGAKPLKIELFYEYAYNLFVTASREPSNTRARNINTIDEVPDSSWFTNRIGRETIAP